MDYPKNSRFGNGPGIPLLYGNTRMPLPAVRTGFTDQDWSSDNFQTRGPQVTDGKGHPIQVLTMKLEDEYLLHQEALPREDNIDRWLQEFPSVWAETGGMGLAAHRTPVLVELKPGESPVRIKQYPMSQEARKGIQPHIRRL